MGRETNGMKLKVTEVNSKLTTIRFDDIERDSNRSLISSEHNISREINLTTAINRTYYEKNHKFFEENRSRFSNNHHDNKIGKYATVFE